MSSDTPDELIVYSDYLCPFCYLGKESMETYLENEGVSIEVEWRPFDIQGHKRGPDGEIDDSVDDGKDETYFEKVRENVERLKKTYGVEMQFDLPEGIDSWNAQKVALAVERDYDRDVFLDFHEALFDALWRDGRDIGDPDVLADLAADCEIEPEDVREAVRDDELDERLEREFERARDAGVRGIPTFVHDGTAAQGAIPPARFDGLFARS